MYTVDRLNLVLKSRKMPSVSECFHLYQLAGCNPYLFRLHAHVFDLLDKSVGVHTLGAVGARLARHEELLAQGT